jgi:hypothetical protein
VFLVSKVVLGEKVVLKNLKNWDEREGTVARVGPPGRGGIARVGIQFREPAPEFWSISTPPEDWNQEIDARAQLPNHPSS